MKKKSLKRKKGFTLIEIIAVIIIIGIIALIAVPAVLSYLNDASDSVYKEHEKAMQKAARNYSLDCLKNNNDDCVLPDISESKKIPLDSLQEHKYLDDLKDPETKLSCDGQNSYVLISKETSEDFNYSVCLVCDNYISETCTTDVIGPTCGTAVSNKKDWTSGNETITVKCIDEGVGCEKGSYSKTFDGNETEYLIEISDAMGNKTVCDVSDASRNDKKSPTCSIKIESFYSEGDEEEFLIHYGEAKAIIDAKDQESGVESFGLNIIDEENYDNNNELALNTYGDITVYGFVKDKSGNTNTCYVNAYRQGNFKLYYHDDFGDGCNDKWLEVAYKKPYKTYITGTDGSLCIPSKPGYTFDGWYDNSENGNKVSIETIHDVPSDDVIYAYWNPNQYNIVFNPNGGTGTIDNKICTYDESCKLSNNSFIRDGYEFLGWSTSSNGNVEYGDGEEVLNLAQSGNVTLYAKWASLIVTISYNGNGATSGSMNPSNVETGTSLTIPANGFKKTNYGFLGWATSANGAVVYGNKAKITPTGNMTLYAVWGTQIENYGYTGGAQTFKANFSGYYRVQLIGAGGGYGWRNGVKKNAPGTGGTVTGTIYITKGTTYYIYVGGVGVTAKKNTKGPAAGGYNGGGAGGKDDSDDTDIKNTGGTDPGGGGGGATDMRTTGGAWNNSASLNSRILVAGGGGGSTYGNTGGNGCQYSGNTNGYSLGIGQNGKKSTSGGGGGGGGYYGGKSEQVNLGKGYGGTYYISSSFKNTSVSTSGSSGNGSAKITFIGVDQ